MDPCRELEFVVPRDRAEAFCEWLRGTFGTEPVSMERPRGDAAWVAVYGSPAEVAGWLRSPVPPEFGLVSARDRPCDPDSWTTFWRHHFRTADIGRRLRVVPAWERAPDRRRVNLRIDPGLSFGTGNHFTTRFCLEQIEAALDGPLRGESFLDAGSGSGVLAVAAAKLGAGRIDAYDIDPVCVAQFPRNRRLNRIPAGRIGYSQGNVLTWEAPVPAYGLVCANILSHLLVKAAPRLRALAARRLLLAGIRDSEADEVADAYLRLGAREILRDSDG